MLGQFEVMDNATMNDSIHAMATNVNNSLLITGDTSGWVSVFDISRWCFNMDTARRYPPNAVHVQPAPPMDGPPVNAHFRCHLYTITNVELVPVQNIIITSSTDCSIRVWTISGTYIGTFGQSEIWRARPTSADEFNLPDDIKSSMTEDQLNKFRRKKRKFNPWNVVKNVMAFAKNAHQLDNNEIDQFLDKDATFRIPDTCDRSYILGKAYHRTTRPRLPMRTMELDQKCGSVLAYNQLDKKDMVTDPVIPNPPNHMKIHGREGLPKFNAQSLDRIASEQQKLANKYLHHDEESDPAEELENSVARSKKYTEKNLFPHGVVSVIKKDCTSLFDNHSGNPDLLLRNVMNVKKAARRFGSKKNALPPLIHNYNSEAIQDQAS